MNLNIAGTICPAINAFTFLNQLTEVRDDLGVSAVYLLKSMAPPS